MCRNVFIYLRRERVAATCRRLSSALAPDGWLALAASESIRGLGIPLEPEVIRGRIFHRKRRTAAEPPAPAAQPPPASDAARPPASSPPLDQALIDEAVARARRGAVREARDHLLTARMDGSERTMAFHLTHGHLCLRLHEIVDALGAYARAADIDPLQCEVHFFEGVAQRKAGAWVAAAAAFRRALFLAPTFWQAAYLLAGVHDRLGSERDAERERARARRVLLDGSMHVVFLSDPVFLDWLAIAENDARRALQIPLRAL
jgi:chemotaxis protein methyltransferase CheR